MLRISLFLWGYCCEEKLQYISVAQKADEWEEY